MKALIKYFILAMILGQTGCNRSAENDFSGYVSGDFVYLSYRAIEKVEKLLVSKGQDLVTMEGYTTENSTYIAAKNYEAELAVLRNLKSGERPEQLDIIRSKLERAESAVTLAKSQMNRYQKLYETHVISGADWDSIKDDFAEKTAQVKELTSQLKAKSLPACSEEIKNQESRVASAKLQLDKARWDQQQNTIVAPQDGLIYDIIYRPGERPVAGQPILSLLPPENIKVRFFVPEPKLGALNLGHKVAVLLRQL